MVQAAMAPLVTTPTKTLVEVILAAHFQAPLNLDVLEIASWIAYFSDFPIVQYLPAAPQVSLQSANAPQQVTFDFALPGTALPRVLLRSPDGRYSIQLQADRFAFGWARIEPVGVPADYPGFESMLEKWQANLERFNKWTEERFQQRPQHRLMELNYANAAPLERDGQKRRLSEIFQFVQTTGRPVMSFNTTWVERVLGQDGVQIGAVTAVVGLGQAPPAVPVLAFNFAGMAEVAPGRESKHMLNDIHAKIREMYQSAILPDAP
jgi:uncharacterized protein (TIGR04255 family)